MVRRCQWCNRDVPEGTAVCPYPDCGRPLAFEGGTAGPISAPPPPPGQAPVNPPGGAGSYMPGPPRPVAGEMPSMAPPPPPPGMPQGGGARPNAAQPGPGQPGHAGGEMPSYSPPPPPAVGQAPGAVPPGRPGEMRGIAPPPPPGMPSTQGGAYTGRPGEMAGAAPPPPPGAPGALGGTTPSPLPPPPAPPQDAGTDVPSGVSSELDAIDIKVGEPSMEGLSSEARSQVEALQGRVRRGRRRSVLLGWGAAAAVALGLLCWAAYYNNATLSYAQVDNLQIARDSVDPDRLALTYEPLSDGRIAFRRTSGDRSTELLDEVTPEQAGKQQKFQWRVTGLKTGDPIEVTYLDGLSLKTVTLTVPEFVKRTSATGSMVAADSAAPDTTPVIGSGEAAVTGRVVNATDNQPIAGAQVRVVAQSLDTRTDADGYFRILGVPGGPQKLAVAADGFSAETLERVLVAGRENSLRVALNPGMDKGQIRLVLTWDQEPKDLDAHLEGPLPGDERFHVYYHQPGDLKSREFVRLDVDNRSGGGPETVTVLGVLPGVYRYFVHDYSNRNDPESTALARSGAEVRLYQGGQTYRFRVDGDAQGNIWDVCSIEVTADGEAIVRRVDGYAGMQLAALGLYDKRTQANREQWIVNYGGSAISEGAVTDGLEWLARHQAPEGFWSSECLGNGEHSQCQRRDPCTGEGDRYEMALTGLALLAFQAGGHYYFNDAEYSEVVRKGLDWMVANQGSKGGLIGTHDKGGYSVYHKHYMYEHGIASFALNEACAIARALNEPDEVRYRDAAQRAVDFIEDNQHSDGGWRYTPDLLEESDTSVTGWQVLALKAALEAGLDVDEYCVQNARTYFHSRETGENGRTGYNNRNVMTDATTGLGMLARQFLFDEADSALIPEAAAYLADMAQAKWGQQRDIEENADYYLWYNCTLAMFHAGGEPWQRWNSIIRDTVISLQRHSGCERGSWDPSSKWGNKGGRIYTTALAVLTLEVYYRYTSHEEREESEPAFELPATLVESDTLPGEIVEPEAVVIPVQDAGGAVAVPPRVDVVPPPTVPRAVPPAVPREDDEGLRVRIHKQGDQPVPNVSPPAGVDDTRVVPPVDDEGLRVRIHKRSDQQPPPPANVTPE